MAAKLAAGWLLLAAGNWLGAGGLLAGYWLVTGWLLRGSWFSGLARAGRTSLTDLKALRSAEYSCGSKQTHPCLGARTASLQQDR